MFVIGELTEPVTGAVVVTRAMLGAFREARGEPFLVDVAVRGGGIQHLFKVLKYLGAALTIPLLSLRYRVTLYMPVNAFAGVYLNIALLAVAGLFCRRVILHHHVMRYLDTFDGRMARLCSLVPSRVLHVTQCGVMSRRLRALYGKGLATVEVSNALWVPERGPPTVRLEGPLVIGHLSNLSAAKGSIEVIEVFDALRSEGHDVRLVLAGPCRDAETETAVRDARRRHAGRFDYLGPVYGRDKDAFFEAIDVFVFPSHTETEGMVTLEALSFGRPVAAYAVGCLPERIDGPVGRLVDRQRPFIETGRDFITGLLRDRAALLDLADAARGRLSSLRNGARTGLDRVMRFAFEEMPRGA